MLSSVSKDRKAKKRNAQRKKAKTRGQAVDTNKPLRYGVIAALTSAPTGQTYGQLWQEDPEDANNTLKGFFGKEKFKLGLIEKAEEFDKEQRYLVVLIVQVHGMDVYAFMYSGVTPNIVSLHFVEALFI